MKKPLTLFVVLLITILGTFVAATICYGIVLVLFDIYVWLCRTVGKNCALIIAAIAAILFIYALIKFDARKIGG